MFHVKNALLGLGILMGLSALACGLNDSENDFSCCISGSYYSCDSEEEVDTCTTDNKCSRDSSKDDTCSD